MAIFITACSFSVSVFVSYLINVYTCKLETRLYHGRFIDFLLSARKTCPESDLITLVLWIIITIIAFYIWSKKIEN